MKARFEKIIQGSNQSFAAFESWSRSFACPYHFHPEFELTAILGGRGVRVIGDHIARFDAGDLVLIGANLPHQYSGDSAGKASRRGCGAVVIQFGETMLGGVFESAPEFSAVRQMLVKARLGLHFRGLLADRTIARMRNVQASLGGKRLVGLLDILGELSEARGAEPLASQGYSPDLRAYQSERIAKACALIHRRFCEPLRESEVAAHVAMSPSAFSRFFRRATGLSFGAFLAGLRLSEASRRLIETDETVSEICYRSGFSNLSNFNRRFLAAKKMTPRQFRKSAPA